jgi:hypothetical protein
MHHCWRSHAPFFFVLISCTMLQMFFSLGGGFLISPGLQAVPWGWQSPPPWSWRSCPCRWGWSPASLASRPGWSAPAPSGSPAESPQPAGPSEKILIFNFCDCFCDNCLRKYKIFLNFAKILTRVTDPDPDPNWIRIQSGQWIRIQEGKNDPQK